MHSLLLVFDLELICGGTRSSGYQQVARMKRFFGVVNAEPPGDGCFSGVAPTIMVSLFLRIPQGEDPLEIAELFIFDL
jgi:hypothetical protein